eukprot:2298890-Prymnesium_polylepis.2
MLAPVASFGPRDGSLSRPTCAQCFVFLSDVRADTHPTKVAKGTNRNVYYSYDEQCARRPCASQARGR